MKVFDAIVVGGGVAGSASAMELTRLGMRVCLLDRRGPIGGLECLSPFAVRALMRLPIAIKPEGCDLVAWWQPPSATRRRCKDATVLCRQHLANLLIAGAEAMGVCIYQCLSIRALARRSAAWHIQFQTSDRTTQWARGSFLVDSTGRSAVISSLLGARRIHADRLYASSAAALPASNVGSGSWTERCRDGWWNLTANGERATLTFFSLGSVVIETKDRFREHLSQTAQIKRLVSALGWDLPQVRLANSSLSTRCSGPGWCAVGDSVSTIQPLSAAGVAKALRDAQRVTDCLLHSAVEYAEFQVDQFQDYLHLLRRQYAFEKNA